VRRPADGLQVAVVVGAAAVLRHDVVDVVGGVRLAVAQARLADTAGGPHDAVAGLVPGRAIAALVSGAAAAISERTGAHLVGLAPGRAVADQGAALAAGFRGGGWHGQRKAPRGWCRAGLGSRVAEFAEL
jgi:hypothetical protein